MDFLQMFSYPFMQRALIAGVLVIGLMGCSVDDIFSNFNVGDVPFEEEHTSPTDMGVVDKAGIGMLGSVFSVVYSVGRLVKE